MPSERRGTVTDDIPGYIRRIQGSSEWKADRTGNIRLPVALVRYLLIHPFYPYANVAGSQQMKFPVDDVIKNFRHLMTSVKMVTGNSKEPAERRASNSGPKPGRLSFLDEVNLSLSIFLVTKISTVLLSTRQGPGIKITDY